jgi:hypothetical protein
MTTQKSIDTIENNEFVLTGRLTAQEHFVEGLTQMFFGFPLTKILFHTTIEPKSENAPEMRKASQYLTMPTITVIELAHLILTTAKQSEEHLMRDLNGEAKDKVRAILQEFPLHNIMQGIEFQDAPAVSKGRIKKD